MEKRVERKYWKRKAKYKDRQACFRKKRVIGRSVMIQDVNHKHKSEERETPKINNAEMQIDILRKKLNY